MQGAITFRAGQIIPPYGSLPPEREAPAWSFGLPGTAQFPARDRSASYEYKRQKMSLPLMHVKPYVLALLLLLTGVAGTAVAQGGGEGAEAEGAPQTESMRILFFGDSITAGYGVGQEQAFPALVRRRIDSLDWNFTVVNGGLSGETSAGGLRRIDWVLRQHVDLFVLELGGNDGLRGIDLASTRQNLQQIIDKVGGTYPDARIVIAGMQVPPNLGPDYTARFESMYPELARENDAELIPFLMEGVGGFEEYMQNDGIHPNARGHERMAQTVWEAIRPILQEMRGS